MNTNQLMTFLVMMREKSYQKAALSMHYSRSVAMDHIKALEHELGVKLFEKSGREMAPTEAGLHFAQQARSLMDTYRQALSDAKEPGGRNLLRVLSVETLGVYFLRNELISLTARHPELELYVNFGAHREFCEKIKNGEADIAFGFSGHSWGKISEMDFTTVHIGKEPVVFFTNPDSKLARLKTVCLADIKTKTFLLTNRDGIYSDLLYRLCRKSGVQIHTKQFIDSGTLLKRMVQENRDYVSLICRSVIERELRTGELIELPWGGETMNGDIIAVFPNRVDSEIRDELLSSVARRRSV